MVRDHSYDLRIIRIITCCIRQDCIFRTPRTLTGKIIMNTKKFILALTCAFVFVFAFEFLWHGFLMEDMYEATITVWRPEDPAYMIYIFASQFLFATVLNLHIYIDRKKSCV
ncbi:MAG: hypothetical protein ACI85N_001882 [Gammaproteobacteria bacterium]